MPPDLKPSAEPVSVIRPEAPFEDAKPLTGKALCLSGGGYRAMLFHVGAFWRLTEMGILGTLDRISSVSGGSITSAVVGMNWSKLAPGTSGAADRFTDLVVEPIRRMADETIDMWSIVGGILTPGVSIADKVANKYRDILFGKATLQDLPDHPRFVINATNVQSGALWRFMKPYMRDYLVGEVKNPTVPLATAVAASSAFPPVLSPMRIKLDPVSFSPPANPPEPLRSKPYHSEAVLSDGGVYDNLGLETAYKRCETILVSDAGGKMSPEEDPASNWAQHSLRINDLIDNQVRSLRKRQLIDAYQANERKGAYWGIRTDIADYKLGDPLSCPHDRTMALAAIPTRLERMDAIEQERLINWGYAVCDAALRKHVDPGLTPPTGFPFPASGV